MKAKFTLLVVVSILCFNQLFANENQTKTALVIVDIQQFYFPSENSEGLFMANEASLKAKKVLETMRQNDQLIIHVRHKTEQGFEIHSNVKPLDSEKVITKTEVNSFNGTDLLEYLKQHEINRLIIIGMQTHMCLEAATRAGYDHGFECIVIEDACATRDLKFGERMVKAEDVHSSTLSTLVGGGYAKVIDLNDFVRNSDMYINETIK